MKAAVLQFFSWPGRRIPLPEVYQRGLSRIQIMDQNGYDAVWLAEHHFNTFSVCPSIHLMATHFAAHTQNLRIGMAVSLAAMYHPLRLAEEVALLDVLSGGRVNWGAGRGFDPTEFGAFDIDPAHSTERFRENVDIVLKAWTQERLTHHSENYHFEDLEVLPKPLQQPHPPTWMAATSPPSVEWAASVGHNILMDPHAPFSTIAKKRELYRTTLEENGFDFAGRVIPMARLLAIAPTREAAEKVARSGAGWTVDSYAPPALLGPASEDVDPVQRYLDETVIWGTPDEVVDKVERLKEEMFLDYLIGAPLSHETFMLFTEKVLPKVAS